MVTFNPKKNIVAEVYKFRQRAQKSNKSMDHYVNVLHDLVRSCDLGNSENDLLCDQIVEKCQSNQLREKLLSQENVGKTSKPCSYLRDNQE